MEDQAAAPSKLLERQFKKVADIPEGNRKVTLLQMNVLAQWLCHDDFPEKPRTIVEWDFRKNNLIQVLKEHSPDVIAIEECDKFSDWFKPELAKLDYDGVFQAKSNKDGTAVFWSNKKFKSTNFKYYRYGADSQGMVMLELSHTDNPETGIYIAATHLKANGEFREQREKQVAMILEEFPKFFNHKNWPSFVLGDFNDYPSSSPIQKMQTVYTSAYDNSDKDSWTTWKKRETEVKRVIDYIFYDKSRATLSQILLQPSNCPTHLPDTFYPSDHLAICAQFGY